MKRVLVIEDTGPNKRHCVKQPTHILILKVQDSFHDLIRQHFKETVCVDGYASSFEEFRGIDLEFQLKDIGRQRLIYSFHSTYSTVYIYTLLSRNLNRFINQPIPFQIDGIYRIDQIHLLTS